MKGEKPDFMEKFNAEIPISEPVLEPVPKWRQTLSVILFVGAWIYNVCPVDLLPAFPLDNLLITGATAFNWIQQNAKNQQGMIVKISRYLKWILLALLVLTLLIFGTFIALILNLLSG